MKAQQGYTLVEIMIGLILGLLLTTAVLSVYLGSSRNLTQDERYAEMQENGRFALKILVHELSMGDFWGKVISPDTLTSLFTVAVGGCADTTDLYSDTDAALLFNNYHQGTPVTQFAPCGGISTDRLASTDVIVVKHVAGTPTAESFVDTDDTDGDGNTTEVITTGGVDLSVGTVYLRTNGTEGTFINDAAAANPPGSGYGDWRYVPRVYFIRDHFENSGDGIPALCRMDMVGVELGNPETGNANEPQCVVQGVEDFHLAFGIDTGSDGAPDLYTTTPTSAQMQRVVSARIYLLVRSALEIPGYTNSKTYAFGDANLGPFNDGFARRVFSTTVQLRNPANLWPLQ